MLAINLLTRNETDAKRLGILALIDSSASAAPTWSTIRVLMEIRPGVRIIAASGLSENKVIAAAVSSAVKHFLGKP
jgi:hypothetical protein